MHHCTTVGNIHLLTCVLTSRCVKHRMTLNPVSIGIQQFKYLGHIHVLDRHSFDNDKMMTSYEEFVICMSKVTNTLGRKFYKDSLDVKILLFKSYRLCPYGSTLWFSISKFKSVYNKCMKLFFGNSQCHCATQLLLKLGLQSPSTNGLFCQITAGMTEWCASFYS